MPARPGADRHALDHKPPGVSSIARVSSPRADRARPMATQPTIHEDAGFVSFLDSCTIIAIDIIGFSSVCLGAPKHRKFAS